MATETLCACRTQQNGDAVAGVLRPGGKVVQPEGGGLDLIEPLSVPAVAESAEAVVEHLDAPLMAAPAILDHARASDSDAEPPEGRAVLVDEYAKAVLYNGLGHYRAARDAAGRACERDDFMLLGGALAELVEASARCGSRVRAVVALRRLEELAEATRTHWAMGLAACARALVSDGEHAERSYLEAIERLRQTRAEVTLARARLVYGEWLRREGRRVDARRQLTLAHRVFSDVGLGGFTDRAHREFLATGPTARKRADDARFDLTAQEAEIAQFAAHGYTNAEIGERLYISRRTVEWHLRKVFAKLGVGSRRDLDAIVSRPTPSPVAASASSGIRRSLHPSVVLRGAAEASSRLG